MPERPCSLCGATSRPAATFCASCGARLRHPPAPPSTPPSTPPSIPTSTPPSTPPRQPDPRRRGRVVAVLALAVSLLAGAVATGVVLGLADPGRPPVSSSGFQATGAPGGVDLLTEPTREWTFDPDDVVPGADTGTVGPSLDGLPPIDVLAFGEVAVTAVTAPDAAEVGGGEHALVGLEAATGDVLWRHPSSAWPGCTPVEADTLLLCTGLDPASDDLEPAPHPLHLLDPATGEATASTARFTRPVVVDGPGDPVVVDYAGGDLAGDGTVGASLVALDGLGTTWTTSLDTSGAVGELYFHLDDRAGSEQLFLAGGGLRWTLDRASGTVAETVTDSAWLEDGYRVESEWETGTTRVTDLSGFTVLAAPGEAWWDDEEDRVRDGRIGIGATLYDLTDGTALWTAADAPLSVSGTADGNVLLGTFTDVDHAQPLDPATGERYFADAGGFDGTHGHWFGPTFAAGVDEAGTLRMHDLDGGAVRWSRPLGELVTDVDGWSQGVGITTTPTSLLVAGVGGVRGLTGFGEDADGGSLRAGGSQDPDPATSYVTDCGTEPELTPVEAVAADGGVSVTYTATATCATGQWLALSDQRVDLSVDGSAYLTGVFDFSVEPRWVSPAGSPLTLVYPPGSALATPEEVDDAIEEDGGTGEVVRVDCERGDAALPGAPLPDPGAPAGSSDPVASLGPADDQASASSALDTLRRLADEDAPVLDAAVAGSWVPQLSSKSEGLVADGLTWDAEEILAEHLRLRLRYPGVRLLWSSDWDAYQLDGFWVTVVAHAPSSTPEPALAFCTAESFDRDHCYAKQPVREGSWEDRTRMLPESG